MHVSNHSFYFNYQMNNKAKSKSSKDTPTDTKDNKVGQLFPNSSLEDYAKKNGVVGKRNDGCDSKHANDGESEEEVYDDKDDNDSPDEDCDEDDEDNDEKVADQTDAKE
jgi:hypothetical protein